MTRCAHATVDPNSKKFERSHRSHPAVISEIPCRQDHRLLECGHGTSPIYGVAGAEGRTIVELAAPYGHFARLRGHWSFIGFIGFPPSVIPRVWVRQHRWT
jgi:hypothetical protein